jgi:predicted nucleic acid-binding protein
LEDGRRGRDLEAAARVMYLEDFDGRVLPFDMKAAAAYADIFASRRRTARPVRQSILSIASVARSHGCGITLINPWDVP